jgi:hypothetical protein
VLVSGGDVLFRGSISRYDFPTAAARCCWKASPANSSPGRGIPYWSFSFKPHRASTSSFSSMVMRFVEFGPAEPSSGHLDDVAAISDRHGIISHDFGQRPHPHGCCRHSCTSVCDRWRFLLHHLTDGISYRARMRRSILLKPIPASQTACDSSDQASG